MLDWGVRWWWGVRSIGVLEFASFWLKNRRERATQINYHANDSTLRTDWKHSKIKRLIIINPRNFKNFLIHHRLCFRYKSWIIPQFRICKRKCDCLLFFRSFLSLRLLSLSLSLNNFTFYVASSFMGMIWKETYGEVTEEIKENEEKNWIHSNTFFLF